MNEKQRCCANSESHQYKPHSHCGDYTCVIETASVGCVFATCCIYAPHVYIVVVGAISEGKAMKHNQDTGRL